MSQIIAAFFETTEIELPSLISYELALRVLSFLVFSTDVGNEIPLKVVQKREQRTLQLCAESATYALLKNEAPPEIRSLFESPECLIEISEIFSALSVDKPYTITHRWVCSSELDRSRNDFGQEITLFTDGAFREENDFFSINNLDDSIDYNDLVRSKDCFANLKKQYIESQLTVKWIRKLDHLLMMLFMKNTYISISILMTVLVIIMWYAVKAGILMY